jgi:hypothetical protein
MIAALSLDQLLIIALALGLGGLTKGLTGLGLPLVTVPVLAGFVGVERAVLIMIIPSVVLNLYPAWTHREAAGELPELRFILLGGLPGAAIGATVLQQASERFLETALAIWIIAYVLLRVLHPSFSLAEPQRRRWSPWVGGAAGALQAATGISAPIIAPYMDTLRLRPTAYVYAVCSCFGAFACAHFTVVSLSGIYTRDIVVQSLLAIVPAIGFIPVGVWARRFVSRAAFDWVIRTTLVIMALRLVYAAWF